ncbi:hypothetical protein B0I37DRAFT_402185 [Chaetomium sp. MPI-CAGE-AT-0009]|nr:hypothetical protein B0I37DRAFT_402185 [Chaetomium sp. MPI-CAGE-AT-0009]
MRVFKFIALAALRCLPYCQEGFAPKSEVLVRVDNQYGTEVSPHNGWKDLLFGFADHIVPGLDGFVEDDCEAVLNIGSSKDDSIHRTSTGRELKETHALPQSSIELAGAAALAKALLLRDKGYSAAKLGLGEEAASVEDQGVVPHDAGVFE